MRVRRMTKRSMLGEGQWAALEAWLLRVKDIYPVKFLVTSCALLYRMWVDFPRDRWSGFPQERDRLLHFLAANGIQNVYLLAGDLHSAHAVRADLYGPEGSLLPLWEFCSSPFEQNPNTRSSRTYWPLRGEPIRSQHLAFTIARHNFGVVRVDYSDPARPGVRFQLFGREGELLGEAGA